MGKRRNEVPPHIFAIAEGAFQGMMQGGKNQSILITSVALHNFSYFHLFFIAANLVLAKQKTPRKLFPILPPLEQQARRRRENQAWRIRLSRLIRCLKPGEMLKLFEMTIPQDLENSFGFISINLESWLELIWLFICWKNLA